MDQINFQEYQSKWGDLLIMGQLTTEQAKKLNRKLKKTWDIDHHYWHPLYDTVRNDVISFLKETWPE